MAGYWIVRGSETRDSEALQAYGKLWPEIAAQFGAELIAGKGQVEICEGPQYARNLIVRFESYEQALACYNSPEYAPAKAAAQQASERELVIVEG
jgi:uncharacterized protein (DUF1330 family)